MTNKREAQLREKLSAVTEQFGDSVESVDRLMNLHDDVAQFCVTTLEKVVKFHTAQGFQEDHPACNVSQMLGQMKRIQTNESLKPRYQAMLNQCVVLLVSYFTSAIQDIFGIILKDKIISGEKIAKLEGKESIRFGVDELRNLHDSEFEGIGELVVAKKQINFQDMKSIVDVFRNYFGIQLKEDANVHNIIIAHACRHVFVHAGDVASEKTIKQVARAKQRDVKKTLTEGDHIQFEDEEITKIADSMKAYIQGLTDKLEGKQDY